MDAADPGRRLRVGVADDDPLLRGVLVDVIASEPGFELVGVSRDAQQAIELAVDARPDVIVCDVRMPHGGGSRVASEVAELSPETKILALSAYSDRGAVVAMLRSGAAGYVVKGAPASEIKKAIYQASRGHPTLSEQVTPALVQELRDAMDRSEQKSAESMRRLALVQHAIDAGQPDLVFQSIVGLSDRRVAGYEVLSRFNLDPPRGPQPWFADAAAAGLLASLETAVLRRGVAAMSALPEEVFLAVNVSPQTLRMTALQDELGGAPAERIVLEITEHAPVDDYSLFAQVLRPLRELGIRIAVDDAGAGYASLKHLLKIDPDILKIDASITRSIDTDPARRALAKGLTSFAAEISAVVIGEAVESAAEMQALQEIGVTYGQGYYFGRPEPLAEQEPG